MRNVSDKSCRENQNTHFVLHKSPPPKFMPFVWWWGEIHSECVILNTLPLQQWLHECTLMLRYADLACPVSFIFLLFEWSLYKFSFHVFTKFLKTLAVIHTKHVFLISYVSTASVVLSCSFDVICSRHDFSSGHVFFPIGHTQKHLLMTTTYHVPP